MKTLREWRKCPFCNGDVVRIRNCEQTEFKCRGECKAIVIFKTTNTDLATSEYNRRVVVEE